MSIKTTLKASVAAAALLAVAAPVVSSPAAAGLANGNDNGVVISGALVRSLMYTDNGDSNDWSHVDGGTDNSRLRILVSGQLTESIAVGGVWEANLPVSQDGGNTTSSTVGGQGTITNSDGGFAFRKTEVTFTHATMGKLSIGQSSTASDNKPSLDSTVNNNAGISHGGGMYVFDKTAAADTTQTSGGAFSSYFGGRADRIRYDTPSIAGFKGAVAWGQDGFADAGLTYGATYGDVQVAAAGQFAHSNGGNEQYGFGVAVKHSSGISAGAHWGEEAGTGEQDGGVGVQGSAWGAEIGYTTTAISNLGSTSFNLIYTEADETVSDNYEAETVSFHVAQKLPAGVDIFASYENASFDDNNAGTDLEDLTVFLVGTRLSF